jgi:hypothetical protein
MSLRYQKRCHVFLPLLLIQDDSAGSFPKPPNGPRPGKQVNMHAAMACGPDEGACGFMRGIEAFVFLFVMLLQRSRPLPYDIGNQ